MCVSRGDPQLGPFYNALVMDKPHILHFRIRYGSNPANTNTFILPQK